MRAFDRSPLAQLTLARVRDFLREPEAVFWTFFFPTVLALALGIAFREKGPAPVLAGVVVTDPGDRPAADSLAARLEAAAGIHARLLAPAAAEHALGRGDVAILVTPRDAGYAYRYDPAREESRVARLAVDDALQRAAGRRDVAATRDVTVRERGARYIDFLIPGLIGLNLLSTGLWGVGYTIVRMRGDFLLKRLVATPMRRGEFLLSFMLGRLAFLVAELVVLLAFARIAFGVQVRGSLAAVGFIVVLGAFSFTGLGLLIASRARTVEGVNGLMNLASVPMWVLSGVFFSAERFPALLHPLIAALPLTALLDALRAVMLDGAPLLATTTSLLVVAGWGAACFGLALGLFRWR